MVVIDGGRVVVTNGGHVVVTANVTADMGVSAIIALGLQWQLSSRQIYVNVPV